MKQRILPGAAGLIALTATMGFIDAHRDVEIESYSRNKISLLIAHTASLENGMQPSSLLDNSSTNSAYLVEIKRGNKTAEVKVDAVTGLILPS